MIETKIEEFSLDKTKCFLCDHKLTKAELKDINKQVKKIHRKDKKKGLKPTSDSDLVLIYVCDNCIEDEYIHDQMDEYGDGDSICMSGADDIFISKKTARICFGM